MDQGLYRLGQFLMKDFLGYELEVGDEVVTTPKNYRGLVKATVLKLTPQKIRVSYINDWNYAKPGREEFFITPPDTCVKIR